jgi:hypothetical protein
MRPRRVRVAGNAIATRSLSNVYRPLRDCTCGMRTRRFPTHAFRPDFVAQRDLSMLPVLCNRRNDHHLEQKSRAEKVERHDDMERGRIG